MFHLAAIGAGRNPRFRGGGGGRYRLPGFCSIGNLEADCKETKTRKQKSLRNVVVFHPHAFLCSTPPFVPVTNYLRFSGTRKTHQKGPVKPAPKTGLPGRSNSRQSRPLPLA